MNLVVYKLILLALMIMGTILAGLSPMKVLSKLRHEAATAQSSKKHKHVSLVLCLLTCFSGGVFLATCFLHLFPELVENVKKLETDHGIHYDYPVAELLSCMGFFLLFFLEEVIIMAIPAMAHGHSHGSNEHHHHNHQEHNDEKEVDLKKIPTSCCMVDVGINEVVEEKSPDSTQKKDIATVVIDETTKLTGTATKGDDGHCQTHCPLTVHERRSSNECKANATQIKNIRYSYGSVTNSRIDENEEDEEDCTFAPVAFAEPERCETNCDAVDEDPPILMKSRPHAHSHGVRSITFVLALGIHSIIEGLAFGVQSDASQTSALFISLMVHKVIVAFSVGLQLFRTHAHQLKWVVGSIFLLACMTPLGALVGLIVSSAGEDAAWKDITITILQGLAVGTFIYVTFFEVLLHERDNEHPNLLKLLVMIIGFMLIGALRLFDSHDHAHGHSHDNHIDLTTIIPSTISQ
ncbi:unnamed protein product [Caenorhabditis angaria]|uniref:Uncharacterized protein n=1 Tax=Caenorhabditis angaria TaxID=860376 RepID=A0A9P1MVW6_9PELO|nr:unnamed protein product [Caenorhabditis angaria]